MSKRSDDDLVKEFLDNGGEVVKLRYATKQDVIRAGRNTYHKDKAIGGNSKSSKYLENQEKKESQMIFSKVDRWRE